jgi:N-hydroxyarylamine O-acetyltransferase
MSAIEQIRPWQDVKSQAVSTYLSRLGMNQEFELTCGPSMDQLQRLMHAHLKTVPFETLDAHFSKRVRMLFIELRNLYLIFVQVVFDIEKIHDKIVNKCRGGFCFELASLFAWLLCKLNYQVRLVLAAVWRNQTPTYLEPCSHLAALVTWPSETATWLVDVSEVHSAKSNLCFRSKKA